MLRDPQVVLQLLTAATLVAVVIGPFLTRRQIKSSEDIARRQITASVVSANRQDWINTLRDAARRILVQRSDD